LPEKNNTLLVFYGVHLSEVKFVLSKVLLIIWPRVFYVKQLKHTRSDGSTIVVWSLFSKYSLT